MYVKHGMGATLQESADVAYNTTTKRFFNPVTMADYGTEPPTGYWMPAQFSIDAADAGEAAEVAAIAAGATPAAAQQANIAASQIVTQQAVAASNGNVVSTTPATTTTTVTTTPVTTTTDYLAMLTNTNWLGNGIPNWAVIAAAGLAAYMFTKGQAPARGGRY